MVEQARKRHIWGWIFLVVLIAAGVGIYFNRAWLYDFYRGVTYQPSSEMVRIRSDLQLTERGEFLFNASQPTLNGSAEFNSYCREDGTEIAVLGCYAEGNIYVYNIESAELNGIRELTTAHELLHAVFARMSDDEKASLKPSLERVLAENQAVLEEDLNTYAASQQFEELYVRAGTEIANLPADLEKHYAEIFKDQDKIAAYYDSYITVFRTLEAEMDSLKAEMEELNTTIGQKTAEYEQRADQLQASVVSFNSCAEVAGCFETEWAFNLQRASLMEEQEALGVLYNEINDLIAKYNAKVEVYNADVSYGEKLNTMINSAAQPEVIKGANEQ